jgi:phospho-N-acetylmuramoyl-pentapeptide-transferase
VLGSAAYPTFQVFISLLVAMVITMALLPGWIRLLKVRQIGQQIRVDGPERHLIKQGTPTMGGVIILAAIAISVALIGKQGEMEDLIPLVLVVAVTLLTGVLGLIDDLSKVVKERSLGLKPMVKLVCQFAIATVFCLGVVNFANVSPTIDIPFVATLDLGVLTTSIPMGDGVFTIPWLYLIFVDILMAGMSNAVNLTDGLDGLAGGCVMIVMAIMAAIAYRADDLNTAIFCSAAAGACIGFLWFNTYPASIFMGDTSSLALGTAVAAVAVITKTEFVVLIIGGIFVIEALSDIIQVCCFKLTGKRVFLMAPLHHHFEKKGWSETKVVIRFWIVSGLLAGAGFAYYFAQGLI